MITSLFKDLKIHYHFFLHYPWVVRYARMDSQLYRGTFLLLCVFYQVSDKSHSYEIPICFYVIRNTRIYVIWNKVSVARQFHAFPVRRRSVARNFASHRVAVKMRFRRHTTRKGNASPRAFIRFPVYFQVREANLFDAGNVSGRSQWLDTFLLRELLDGSRIRVPWRHHGGRNLQRGIYSRYANNSETIARGGKKIREAICEALYLPHATFTCVRSKF